MEFGVNILASLAAGVILTGLAISWRRFIPFFSFGSIRKVWSPFLKGNTVIVITGRPGLLPRSTTKVSFSETRALLNLKKFFEKFGSNFEITNSIDANSIQYIDKNIILLGSQKANEVTKEFSNKIAIPFSYDSQGNLVSHSETFPSTPDNGESLKQDHALILKCVSPYGTGNRMFILAGNHGAATEAAARYVVSRNGIAEIARKLGDSDFTAVLRVQVENNNPKSCKLIKCWKFQEVLNER